MKTLFGALLLVCSFCALADNSLPANRHIAVRGSAELTTTPDIAVISFMVSSQQATSLDAKKDVDKRVNQFLDGLDAFAVQTAGVTATNLLTEPHYTYDSDGNELLSGYRASRSLSVRLTNIDQLNSLLNFALEQQINEVKDIRLHSTKNNELRKKVAALAVENAKSNAEAMANAFDATLGKVYSINSNTEHQQGRYERIEVTGSRVDSRNINASAGRYLQATITFKSTVNAVYDLTVN
ncbi:SIMPL domain-containing protein [Rheinheimera baltica]|uniref:SIMPL domain-containing protein n=1 Tax=Rheinheimera baltica TaxID=67576 RepID=UPI00273F5FF6|nr:SIMPL domain-containing protein [Rheinheimera baltica]MDP5149043.1 SIMPL domain-containing protein [Rheinheimera baltica]